MRSRVGGEGPGLRCSLPPSRRASYLPSSSSDPSHSHRPSSPPFPLHRAPRLLCYSPPEARSSISKCGKTKRAATSTGSCSRDLNTLSLPPSGTRSAVMAPEGSSLVEKDRNSEPAEGFSGPEASPVAEVGGGSGESHLCGIRPGEEEEGGVVSVGDEKEGGGDAAEAASWESETDGMNISVAVTTTIEVSAEEEGYHTPTSPQHRIPSLMACPPAPRKPASARLRTPPQRRRRVVLDLETKLLVATWWAERVLGRLQPEEAVTAKRPRIRDV